MPWSSPRDPSARPAARHAAPRSSSVGDGRPGVPLSPASRRTVPRGHARAALAAVAGVIFLGLALTATTGTQRLLGVVLAAVAALQAWREVRRASRHPRP